MASLSGRLNSLDRPLVSVPVSDLLVRAAAVHEPSKLQEGSSPQGRTALVQARMSKLQDMVSAAAKHDIPTRGRGVFDTAVDGEPWGFRFTHLTGTFATPRSAEPDAELEGLISQAAGNDAAELADISADLVFADDLELGENGPDGARGNSRAAPRRNGNARARKGRKASTVDAAVDSGPAHARSEPGPVDLQRRQRASKAQRIR